MKKWPLEYQMVTETYLPIYLCEGSDSSDSFDCCNNYDSSDNFFCVFFVFPNCDKTQNSNCDNSKTQIVTKLKLKLWHNSKSQIKTKLKISKGLTSGKDEKSIWS